MTMTYSGLRHRKIKNLIFDKLGNKCVYCGIDDKRVFQIDHVQANGGKDYRKQGVTQYTGGIQYYIRVLRDTTNKYQILCANCNQIKRVEMKESTGNPKHKNMQSLHT